jgi:hypothetical protein
MSEVLPIPAFTMLPGAGPACEGDDCLPVTSPTADAAAPASAGAPAS